MDVSEAMQQQAKALADPSRFRLFQHVANATEPVGVAELTELLGFNHNAIRQHLAVLTDAGLLSEANERRTVRGRPRKQYTLRADALNAFSSVSGSYERLAELLLELAATGGDPYDIGFGSAAKVAIGIESDASDVARSLMNRLADDGFEPKLTKRSIIDLQKCPFADVAAKDPSIVCELHRGLIDGYLAAQEPRLVGGLRLRDPHKGGCRVTLTKDNPTASNLQPDRR